MDMERIAIIGAGIGGVQAASSLAGSYDVTLINGEDALPYYRMRIEELLGGSGIESLQIHPAAWYAEKGISLISGHAVRIADHAVILSSGESVPFDKAIIATGARPRMLSLGRSDAMAIRFSSDVMALRQRLDGGAAAVAIIGGGLLGLEAAASIREHYDVKVSVVETAPYILPNQLDEETSAYLRDELGKKGIDIITGAKADKAGEDSLALADGRTVPADILCYSAGVIPETSLAEASGISIGKGILVSSSLGTSMPDVYAIGDAAELEGRTFGLALHAREMGIHVASVIKGTAAGYVPSQPMTQLKVAGIDLSAFGAKDGSRHEIDAGEGRAVVFEKDGLVTGVVLVGARQLLAKAKGAVGKPFADLSL